jgi:hypothetical protein
LGRINLYIVFFISLIDFDWIASHLISNRVRSGLVGFGRFDFFFLNQVRLNLDSDELNGFFGSDRIMPHLICSNKINCSVSSIYGFQISHMRKIFFMCILMSVGNFLHVHSHECKSNVVYTTHELITAL